MNGMLGNQARTDELTITFHFSDGERFTQSLPIDHADAAEDIIDWFKDKKSCPVWTWINPSSLKVQMIPRSQVTFIEIDGYLMPEGVPSKWYQRLLDKIRTYWMLRKM